MIRKHLAKPFKWVWAEDPCLDREAESFSEKWKEWEETGNPEVLPTSDKLTVFDCKPLIASHYLAVMRLFTPDQTITMDALAEAVRRGVEQVHGYVFDGGDVRLTDKDFRNGRMTDAAFEKIWDPHLCFALGAEILMRSRLDPTRGQG